MTRFQCRSKRSQMQFRRRLALTYSNWRWSNAHIDSRSFRWRFLHYILTEDYRWPFIPSKFRQTAVKASKHGIHDSPSRHHTWPA